MTTTESQPSRSNWVEQELQRLIESQRAKAERIAQQLSEDRLATFGHLAPGTAERLGQLLALLERHYSSTEWAGLGPENTVVRALADLMMIADRHAVSFDSCVQAAAWECACELLSDETSRVPATLIEAAPAIVDLLPGEAGAPTEAEVRDLGSRLDREKVLDLTLRERALLPHLRQALGELTGGRR